jgi:hypothetical protein
MLCLNHTTMFNVADGGSVDVKVPLLRCEGMYGFPTINRF